VADITSPMTFPTFNITMPARAAKAYAGVVSSRSRNTSRVQSATMTLTDRISTPIVVNTAPSNAVAVLKCDATPRHCCMSINATSAMSNAATAAACRVRRTVGGIKLNTHASDRHKTPVENPNVMGLRQLTGPSRDGIPTVSQTATWKTAEARNSSAALRSVTIEVNIVKIFFMLIFTVSR
jgi:hypothetical protein